MAQQRRRWREGQQLARLCDLVADSLLPHLEPEPPATQLTRDDERRVLLALTRVNKAIRGWDDEEEDVEEQGRGSDQVGFLGLCSNYVKHSAGNILIAMSNSLMRLHLLFLSCESTSQDTTISSTSITNFMAVLQLRCLNTSGQMMASLLRVLHTILKFLKLNDSELKDDFICLSNHQIQKLRWDPYYQLNAGELVSLVKDDRYNLSNDSAQLKILSVSLLQLLCSSVEQSDMEDTDGRYIFVKFVDVIPKLAAFLQEQQHIPKSLSQYSKHKILELCIFHSRGVNRTKKSICHSKIELGSLHWLHHS